MIEKLLHLTGTPQHQNPAHHADLDSDWLVLDKSSWYPYVDEPDLPFQNAHQSFPARNYDKAAEEIRKREAFVKLEARADRALAQSHEVEAKESWAKKETVKTGYETGCEMKAGARLLEQSAAWSGSEAKSGASTVVSETKTPAGKLAAGSGYAAEEVGDQRPWQRDIGSWPQGFVPELTGESHADRFDVERKEFKQCLK